MLFAIGDIHGHFNKLKLLMAHCTAFAESRGERHVNFVLLGDCIDRGPQSRQVVEFLLSKPRDVQAICGNHEDMMVGALDGGTPLMLWLANGGEDTLTSYHVSDIHDIPSEDINLIANLPTFLDDGLRLFVHAGIDPRHPASRDRKILLWTRKHPAEDAKLNRFLIHGHTPVKNGRPELKRNRLNLDTGAGWGRDLTAAAFPDGGAFPIAFLNDRAEVTKLPPAPA